MYTWKVVDTLQQHFTVNHSKYNIHRLSCSSHYPSYTQSDVEQPSCTQKIFLSKNNVELVFLNTNHTYASKLRFSDLCMQGLDMQTNLHQCDYMCLSRATICPHQPWTSRDFGPRPCVWAQFDQNAILSSFVAHLISIPN